MIWVVDGWRRGGDECRGAVWVRGAEVQKVAGGNRQMVMSKEERGVGG